VHDALRHALDPAVVRMLAEAVEVSHTGGAPSEKKNGKRQSEFLDAAWGRCEELLRPAAAAWARLEGERANARPLRPDSLALVYRKYLRDAMRLLAVESIFPGPLPPAARRVLPASSPKVPATALWGPVMALCLFQVLAEGIDEDDRSHTALHLFDRLRLREPLAHAFNALGLEGEWGWRAAARLKVLLIIQSHVTPLRTATTGQSSSAAQKPAPPAETLTVEDVATSLSAPKERGEPLDPIIPQDLWQDPDVRWLTGFNEAEGHAYVVREPFEELLWWLSLPELLKLAAVTVPSRAAGTELNRRIQLSLSAVEKAGYRVDALMKQQPAGSADQPNATTLKGIGVESKAGKDAAPRPADHQPQEPSDKAP
jgi:hypothetical protein